MIASYPPQWSQNLIVENYRAPAAKGILREKIRTGHKITTVIDISPDKGNEILGKGNKD